MLEVTARPGGARFVVRVKPRAAKSQIRGVREGVLDVSVAAPPVDGEANAELVRILSRALGVPRRAVRVVTGETGRRKVVEIEGLEAESLGERLLK